MDNKSFLPTLMIMILLVMGFMFFTRGGFGGGTSPTSKPFPMYQSIPAESKAMEAGASPRTVPLGSAAPQDSDKFAVRVNNTTAGIDLIQLNQRDYAATVKRTD